MAGFSVQCIDQLCYLPIFNLKTNSRLFVSRLSSIFSLALPNLLTIIDFFRFHPQQYKRIVSSPVLSSDEVSFLYEKNIIVINLLLILRKKQVSIPIPESTSCFQDSVAGRCNSFSNFLYPLWDSNPYLTRLKLVVSSNWTKRVFLVADPRFERDLEIMRLKCCLYTNPQYLLFVLPADPETASQP